MHGLIGRKIGMTRIFNNDGVVVPVTVVHVEVNSVTQIKNDVKEDGCCAIQVTTGNRKKNRLTNSEIGHFVKAGVRGGRGLWEFRVTREYISKIKVGQFFGVESLLKVQQVDVVSVSKGKGFSGTIKRWNFCSQDASHGNSLSHRVPGSIGQNQTPGRVFRGKKMPGQLGNKRVTIQNLVLVSIDKERNLLLIKGAVPGYIGSDVIVKPSIKTVI
ncbi:50S ribosomal protein L3 [Blochmannia endosymbiont of Camponotus (Colobopsis) obliquus]|uniref:50S ribosomal protein L3 n=1 Tax=Blochmannia endosymbiont of Camponotus (Colobopsis) obliquus TaxID=1505597 RepID=UPI00061A5669|nr:50S ribosomal protein L3 [Blochmannia endosymbiont of Camponotus (Colobopsis) obliquus]AKC60361.1 50S ribosomal protein L3 [Blochmannia endosymbiont of Camponotus (Colobopsis) obliquus]